MSEIKDDQNPSNAEIIEKVKTTIQENPSGLNLMKKGDYSVHVLIEEIKNLISIKKDHLPKPMIKVTCFGQTKRTSKPKNDCDAYTFNEHIYFDATDLSSDTLDSSKVLIEAYDYHNFSRKYYFGVHEFDFEYIYSKEKHCIKNLWIALANPEANDITKINGYLKLSISITSTEDEKVELNPDPSKDEDCMVPPQIKTTYKQLEISIYKGENFPDMENLVGKERTKDKRCNARVEVKYLGIVKTTQTLKMEGEFIDWNEIIQIPVPQPTISKKVFFYVKDKKNNIIGSFIINLDDIESKKYEELSCINVYGTLKAADNSKAGMRMNQSPEICSRWKGRVYLKINLKDCEYPIAGVQPNRDYDFINTLRKGIPRKFLWSLYVKLYSAYFLPKENGSYSIKLAVQEKSHTFQEQKAIQRNINWNKCHTFIFESYTKNLEELPDLIIYLMKGDDEICFQRIKVSHFHLLDDILVIKLFPEPCVNKVEEIYHSGLVKIKIKLFNTALDPKEKCDVSAFKDGDELGKNKLNMGLEQMIGGNNMRGSFYDDDDLEVQLRDDPIPNDNMLQENPIQCKFYRVVACVYMTRYLVAGDANGMSDPYCVINIDGEIRQTSVKNKCVNGIWNEILVFDTCAFVYGEKSTWPIMLLTVMDKDYASSDMLGYSYLWLMDTNYELNHRGDKPIKPKWEQLYLQKSNKAQGQILLSFYIYDEEHKDDYKKLKIEPETTPYNFEINALGLRSLKPLSFIKIKKPFVSFDLNSINVSSTNGEGLQPVATLPNETGADPNINSVIKFTAKLPTDKIFIPEFQCNVYDHVLGGLSKRVLGIFLIDIKQIMSETIRHYKEEKEEAEIVLKEMEDNKNIIQENGMSEKIEEPKEENTKIEQEPKKEIPNKDNKEEGKIDVNAPKIEMSQKPKIELKSKKLEMKAPKVEGKIDVNAPKIEMSQPKIELKSKKIDMKAPKVEGKIDVNAPKIEMKSQKVEINAPKIEMKKPEIKIKENITGEVNASKPSISIPSIEAKAKMEPPKVEVPSLKPTVKETKTQKLKAEIEIPVEDDFITSIKTKQNLSNPKQKPQDNNIYVSAPKISIKQQEKIEAPRLSISSKKKLENEFEIERPKPRRKPSLSIPAIRPSIDIEPNKNEQIRTNKRRLSLRNPVFKRESRRKS